MALDERNNEIIESPMAVRVGEGRFWQLDTKNYGGSPTGAVIVIMDAETRAIVTSQILVSGPVVNGDMINFTVKSLVVRDVVLTVQFTNAANAPALPFARVSFFEP